MKGGREVRKQSFFRYELNRNAILPDNLKLNKFCTQIAYFTFDAYWMIGGGERARGGGEREDKQGGEVEAGRGKRAARMRRLQEGNRR